MLQGIEYCIVNIMSDLSAMDGLEPLGAKILVLSIESNEYFIQSLQTVKRFVEDTSYGFYSLTNA